MATTLHLVRHAAHGLLGRVLAGRMPDVALNADGEAQARRLAQHFAGRPVRAVVSSPMLRAQQTAAPIAAEHGLPVVTEAGFDEIDFGDWMGMPFDALDGRTDWQAWNAFRSTAAPPGGETMLAAQARALAAVGRIRRRHPDGEVTIVGHQDVLKALLTHWLGMPLDLFHRLDITPASRSVVVLGDDDVRVEGVNLPA